MIASHSGYHPKLSNACIASRQISDTDILQFTHSGKLQKSPCQVSRQEPFLSIV